MKISMFVTIDETASSSSLSRCFRRDAIKVVHLQGKDMICTELDEPHGQYTLCRLIITKLKGRIEITVLTTPKFARKLIDNVG